MDSLVSVSTIPAAREKRTIGAVLVDAGRLSVDDAGRILRHQKEKGISFGEAALQLGVLTQSDIDYALSKQFDYSYLVSGDSAISEDVVAAYAPFSPVVESMRGLRTELILRWFDTNPPVRAISVVSGDRKEGRSFVASNLAVVFSQLGQRTLLIDADLRRPRQHVLFGLANRSGLSGMLAGRSGYDAIQRIPALPRLAVLPAGPTPPNPQELLAQPAFLDMLGEMSAQQDVIIVDTPAAAESADAQIITVRTGAALIVARKNAARKWKVQGVTNSVVQGRATIVGAVLNSY